MRKYSIIACFLGLIGLQAAEKEDLPEDFIYLETSTLGGNFSLGEQATEQVFLNVPTQSNPPATQSYQGYFPSAPTYTPTTTQATTQCDCTDKEGNIAVHFAMRHNAFPIENLPCPLKECSVIPSNPTNLINHLKSVHKISSENIISTLFCKTCNDFILEFNNSDPITKEQKTTADRHIGHTLIPQMQFIHSEEQRAYKEQWTSLEIQETTPLIKPLDRSKHPSIKRTHKRATDKPTTTQCDCADKGRNLAVHFAMCHNAFPVESLPCPLKDCPKRPSSSRKLINHLQSTHKISLKNIISTLFCKTCNDFILEFNNSDPITKEQKTTADRHIGHTLIPQMQFIHGEEQRACKEAWTSLGIQESTPLIQPLDTSQHPSIECTCKSAITSKQNILFHHIFTHNGDTNDPTKKLLLSCPIQSCEKTSRSQPVFQKHLKTKHDLELGQLPLTPFCTKCNELCPHYNAKGNEDELSGRRKWLNKHFNGPFQLMLDATYFTKSNNNPSDFKHGYLPPIVHSMMESNTLEKERSIQTQTICPDSCIKSAYWMIHFAFHHNQLKQQEETLCPLKHCPSFYGHEQSNHLRWHGESFFPTKMPFFLHCITCDQTCPFIERHYKSKLGINWSKQHNNHALVVLIDPRVKKPNLYKKNWSMPPVNPEYLPQLTANDMKAITAAALSPQVPPQESTFDQTALHNTATTFTETELLQAATPNPSLPVISPSKKTTKRKNNEAHTALKDRYDFSLENEEYFLKELPEEFNFEKFDFETFDFETFDFEKLN